MGGLRPFPQCLPFSFSSPAPLSCSVPVFWPLFLRDVFLSVGRIFFVVLCWAVRCVCVVCLWWTHVLCAVVALDDSGGGLLAI